MFRFFRRYQKSFIVVGGVILMFVFTIGDSLTGMLRGPSDGGNSRSASDIAVKWDGGRLTEGELDTLRQQRMLANRFVRDVASAGYSVAQSSGYGDLPPQVSPVGIVQESWTSEMLDHAVVQTHILANQARRLGIQVSDETIIDYISDLGRKELGPDTVRAIVANINPGGRSVKTDQIYEALREELLANIMASSYGGVLGAELPVNRWEEWLQVNDRVVIEAAAIDPKQFVIDVPEPTDAQLREYYEEFKNRPPFPVRVAGVELPSAEPGFLIPRKVRLQYLRANHEEFVDRFAKEVTDEQIAEYYEENKILFTEAESFDDLGLKDEQEEMESEESGEVASPEGESEKKMPDESAELTEEQPTPGDTAEPEPETPEPETPEPETIDPETIEEPTTEEESPEPETESPTPEPEAEPAEETPESVQRSSESPFELVAYQEDAESAEAPKSETPASEVEPNPDGEDASDAAADDETVAPDKELSDEEFSDKKLSGAELSEDDSMSDDATMSDAAESGEPPAVKYQPLEEVSDEIRQRIAEDRFFKKIDKSMETIAARLNPTFNKYLGARLDATAGKEENLTREEKNKIAQELAKQFGLDDLSELAREFKLENEETVDLNMVELSESAVGRSIESQKYNQAPVWQVIFGTDVDVYEPIMSSDVGRFGNRYLSMKIRDEPTRVPEFHEIKSEVAAAWKRAEAAKLALERAKSLAEEAADAGVSLEDFFQDNESVEVSRTSSFTKFTAGDIAPMSQAPDYRLSQPDGIEYAGLDFMNEIFKLEEGETSAALNNDHSIAYVIRLADQFESPEKLKSDFLEDANFWPGRYVFWNANRQQLQQAVLNDMLADLNIDWQRPEEAAAE